jgi:pseudouridine-5'-phosphate glycosidase
MPDLKDLILQNIVVALDVTPYLPSAQVSRQEMAELESNTELVKNALWCFGNMAAMYR